MDRSGGSIGIGAMIIFIALILVAAVASTVIIKSVEKLSGEADETLDDKMHSKISIEGIQIFLYEPCWQSTATKENGCSPWGHHEMIMTFTVVGDVSLSDTDVSYMIHCPETRTVVTPARFESFAGSTTWDSKTSLAEGYHVTPFNRGFVVYMDRFLDIDARANTLEPGVIYAVMIDLYDNNNNFGNNNEGCRISMDYDVILTIFVDGGMETYAHIKCQSFEIGTSCY